MRTTSDPLRASRKRIAELRNLGNVDLDRLGRLVDPVVDRFFTRNAALAVLLLRVLLAGERDSEHADDETAALHGMS
jgi:hypothetical protein